MTDDDPIEAPIGEQEMRELTVSCDIDAFPARVYRADGSGR